MQLTKITGVIIRRRDDQNTVAIVEAECDPEMVSTVNDLFGAISRAVISWSQTPGGVAFLKSTGGYCSVDNVAEDLLGERDVDFKKALAEWGVVKLAITCYPCEQTSWDYDDNLRCPE